ncbi:MAG TPA: DNA translocase FtsK [Rectinemataceae bacterium]|nr:DNA translocase FtsK [Rectinemataceae bacterium]
MHDEPNEERGAGAGPSLAIVGGILIAFGILLSAMLLAGLAGPNSPLGQIGKAFFAAFSWAAWILPLWSFAAAWLAYRQSVDIRRAFAFASLSLPFLSLAAFARTLDLANPLFPSLGPSRTRFAALGFVAAASGLTVLIAWFAMASRDESAVKGDGVVEEGHRPGLDFAETEDSVESGEPSDVPIAAGRRVGEAEEVQAAATPLTPSTPPTPPTGPGEDFPFSLPDIPPPLKLRSLVAGRPTPAVTPNFATPAPGRTDEPDAGRIDESREIATQETEVRASDEGSNSDGAAEAPIPLFFRDEPGSGSDPAPATMEEITVSSVKAPAIEEGPSFLPVPAAPALGEIEIISVPPQPAAETGAEVGKAAIVQRILARKKKPEYVVPVGELLFKYPDGEYWIVDDKTRRSAEVLRETLAEFGIEAEVTGIRKGPVITMFEILPAPGVRLSKIANLSDNIALRLAASSVRIVAPIPGKHAVGIEVPNERRSIVSLREIVESEVFVGAKAEVPVALGKDIAGEVQFIDLTQTPHLLIAGSTGSGKSVCVNSIILSILFRRSPEEVRLLLIDPKIVELKLYNDVPHLLTPVITEPKRAFQALQYCICEMERRYAMLDRLGVRDIRSYNRKVKEKALVQERLPYIVVIIDEFADLMATTGKELESTLARLAAMSRAVGIHLVLATQRPSIDVITGLIKANIPSRVAFMVASKFDSRIIIDMVGAEKLLGKGDMLFASAWDPFPIRMQGAFVSEEEVEKAVEYIKTLGEPEYIDEDIFIDDDEDEAEPNLFDDGDGDPLFEQALEIVLQQGKASASYIQRKLKIGYNRAARLVELMEEKGIVGKAQGSKPRDLVRNPSITGMGGPNGDSAGHSRAALRLQTVDAEEVLDGGPLPVAGHSARGEGSASSGLPPLVSSLETVPGQRVMGRDED